MMTKSFIRTALAGAMLVFGSALATAEESAGEHQHPQPAPTPEAAWEGQEPPATPTTGSLHIEHESIDFGRVEDGTRVPFAYEIRNTADFPVRIVNISTGCGCTSSGRNPEVIGAGETETFRFEFASAGRVGTNRQTITILTDDPERSTYRVFFSGEVYTAFQFDPPSMQLGTIPHGESLEKEFSLLYLKDDPVELTDLRVQGERRITIEQLDARPYEGEHGEGTEFRFRLTVPENFPVQQFTTVASIETNQPNTRPLNYLVRGEVAGEMAFSPNRLFLVVAPGETEERSLRIFSRRERPFEVKSVEVIQGDIPAEFTVRDTESLSEKELVTAVTGPDQPRTIQGRVKIEFEGNDGEEILPLEVPAVIVVRPAPAGQ